MIKSLKKLNKRGSQPKQRENKSEIATITPKAIVKALYDYDAQGDDELSFRQRDFLYVVDNSDPDWFVACNPLSNSSGLVPSSYFEIIQRPEVIPSVSLSTAMTKGFDSPPQSSSRPGSSNTGILADPSPTNRKSLALYGFVLYDFSAERNDELEAKRGESIIIIAQSNAEWFVAKPIGRLGGPGLIPVSYVQLREVGTDKPFENFEEAIQMAGIPQVEEWKRRAAEYKASSIPLGRFEDPQQPVSTLSQRSSGAVTPGGSFSHHTHSTPATGLAASALGSAPAPTSASTRASGGASASTHALSVQGVHVQAARVDRFAINGGRYWYLVTVEMSNGKHRNLCRYYQDFYDFQIKLLEEFPEEAGRTGKPRTLPFMPGPLTLVNHSISSQRRANLDEYVRKLVCMPPHISRSPLINQLFAVRTGDIEGDEPTSQTPIPPEDEGNVVHSERIDPSAQQQKPNLSSLGANREAPPPLHIPAHNGAVPALATPLSATPSSIGGGDHVKVKVFHDSELIAIRVPTSLMFNDLYSRIAVRLSLERPQLYLTTDFSGPLIDSDPAFRRGIVNGKIVLYAK